MEVSASDSGLVAVMRQYLSPKPELESLKAQLEAARQSRRGDRRTPRFSLER